MESGQPAGIRQLHYAPAAGARFGVEVLDFAELRRTDPDGDRTRPQRPDFHLLALVRSGSGRHQADFVDYPLAARSVVWIRPGTVHRWSDVDRLTGALVLFEPGLLPADLPLPQAPAGPGAATWQLDEEHWTPAVLAADHLAIEHAAALADPGPASAALLAHLLAVLLLRVLPTAPPPAAGPARAAADPEVFARYRAAVEQRFAACHQVADYARSLGYDRRTLTRATRAATGLGAKQYLDRRILLEAKRLLAHTELPVAGCAERVGFADAANFTTFFQRQTTLSPSRWRAERSGR
ncbi:helix-turn-helix domain-containing protein [Kitasatospora sp. LaBMicrA B282]|uniref:helix-turn-helix domain-containing protein n=1 Tax=Kitasatospora sp. LaBMicrA B282 TaxID=3420949 RepID=UPI003D0F6545